MSNKLNVKQIYGVASNSRNSLAFSAEHNIVYNSGAYVVVMNTESKEQGFISCFGSHLQNNKSCGVTAIATSLPKKFIALAQRGETHGIVVFYDSNSLRKKKVLNYPELGSKEYKCIAFSDDGRQCLTQGAGPDWNLVLWSVEKSVKAIANVKVSLSDDNPVNQVSFCPWDPTLAVAVGKCFVRLFRIIDGAFKVTSVSIRRDNTNIISHIWLPDDVLLLGTEAGEILLLESNELRGVVYPTPSPGGVTSSTAGSQAEEMTPVYCFCQTPRGFAAGTVDGEVRFFERSSETREMFQLIERRNAHNGQGKVLAMALDIDDTLVITTDTQQLFTINMGNLTQARSDSSLEVNFEALFSPFHSPNVRGEGAITGMDLALWKPLLATTGMDKTLRLWNPTEKKMEAMHQFEEEATSMALHPSGLYAAVAFAEKVQILSLLLDGFAHCRDLNVRGVNIVRFSNGGQFIACGTGSVVQVYHTYSGQLHCSLRGHTNKIKSLRWLKADTSLMTVGAEGASYYWEMVPEPKKSQDKSHSILSPFTCGTTDSSGSVAFLASSERIIREVSFTKLVDPSTGLEGEVREPRDIEIDKGMVQLLYDESRKVVIVATADEEQPSYVLTMSASPKLTSHNTESVLVHNVPISVCSQSYDYGQVYTADINGILTVSEFEGFAHSTRHRESSAFSFKDEVSIRSETLSEKKKMIADLSERVEELKLNNEHQLRLKEMDFKDREKDISVKFELQLKEEHEKYDKMVAERSKAEAERFNDLSVKKEAHTAELHGIEVKYKAKLNAEATRYKALLSEVESTHTKWNEENAALVNSHQAYLKELCYQYEEKLAAEHSLQKKFLEEKRAIQQKAEGHRDWIENDGDEEVLEVRSRFETRLRNEEETGVDLMAQHALIRKQLQNLNKDGELQKEEIGRLRDRELRLSETISSLEKDIQLHKKEIREREETITDKEKRIFDLKKKNQELEKFRFVLDYKIRELKLQIEPREKETAALRRQSEEMALELEQYQKSGQALELMLNELRLKSEGLRKELNYQEERDKANTRLLEKFKRDLRETWEVSADVQAFKSKVVKMYRFYVQEDVAGPSADSDAPDASDPQEIYNRDREQLERSLEGLRRALKTDAMAHKRDTGKMMREGVILTGELNTLKRDARSLMLQRAAIDRAGGIGPKTDIPTLMKALNIEVKKTEREKKSEQEAAMKAAKTSAGSADDKPPPAPNGGNKANILPSSRQSKSRSSALRRTLASGTTVASSGVAQDPSSSIRGDQWAAWKEIQMQNVQMGQLEERLTTQCNALGIDALHILVSIDANLNLTEGQEA